jgi:hypothetical protein
VDSLTFGAILCSFTTVDGFFVDFKKILLERAAVIACAGQMAAM